MQKWLTICVYTQYIINVIAVPDVFLSNRIGDISRSLIPTCTTVYILLWPIKTTDIEKKVSLSLLCGVQHSVIMADSKTLHTIIVIILII